MLYSHLRAALICSCAGAMTMCGAVGGAQAATNIFGGGSTLASIVYPEMFNVFSQIFEPGVQFGTGPSASYVADGSGAGQSAFLNNQPQTHGLACGTDIAYGASDATLSGTPGQIGTWNTSAGGATVSGCTTSNIGLNGNVAAGGQGGPLIQLPTFGTTIAIAYNTPNQPNNGQLRFTDAQLCGVFSGLITSWSDAKLTNGAGDPVNYPSVVNPANTGTATTAPTGAIFVAFRSDGSGTSFLTAQHLHAVCTPAFLGTGANNLVGGNFTASTTFANNFVGGTPPANFHGFSGSGGVQGAVLANSDSIAYLSPDFTLAAPVNIGTNGTNPPAANVLNSNNSTYYLPTSVNGKNALAAGTSLPADPTQPANYVPAVANPSTGYPIVGYTTWDLATCYQNAAVGEALRAFVTDLYTQGQMINLLTVNGFSPIPTTLSGYINKHILSITSVSNPQQDTPSLRMQDASICQSEGASGAGTFAGR